MNHRCYPSYLRLLLPITTMNSHHLKKAIVTLISIARKLLRATCTTHHHYRRCCGFTIIYLFEERNYIADSPMTGSSSQVSTHSLQDINRLHSHKEFSDELLRSNGMC